MCLLSDRLKKMAPGVWLTGAALVGLEQHAALVQVQLAQDGRRLAAHRHTS